MDLGILIDSLITATIGLSGDASDVTAMQAITVWLAIGVIARHGMSGKESSTR